MLTPTFWRTVTRDHSGLLKVWAASDSGRRASKRQKDLADISRLLEGHPGLRRLVPQSILQRLIE